MMPVVALLDANVLYPASLRDMLLQLAFAGFYQARWSAEIDEEWKRNLLAARPELEERIERTQAVMRRAIPDALVTGYVAQIPKLVLPDANDRHVLAAAITAEAEVIVTFNVKDFPLTALAPHGLVAQHPDRFLQGFIASIPTQFLAVVRQCTTRLIRPPLAAAAYLEVLRRLGLQETAAFLQSNLADWQP
jgi:predicted nucleic acid-binding protein